MNSFLELVAKDLYNKLGNNLSHTAVVFPNKRASLFFNEHLASQSEQPLWAPTYISISDLFRQLSPLKAGDPIQLVCQLHKIFCQVTGSEETLDDFYFWGELLISDFDDLDKNLVDAKQLFSNLQDLKTIMDDKGFLTEEQVEAIKEFFQNFSPERRTELKERFISLWDKLGDIYHNYHTQLSTKGIAYEGMMYRNAMEHLDCEALPHERYVFVGFNVLNQVETQLFRKLKAAGKAMFYWDYDIFYTQLPQKKKPTYTHEAGEFILRNLQLFPNELPEEYFNAMSIPKQVEYISAPTENAQARYLNEWLQATNQSLQATHHKNIGKETAVVLCNEKLLLPVLHSLPKEVEKANITMGFPLSQTPIYSLINALIELHTTGYRKRTGTFRYGMVLALLKHPYVRRLSPNTDRLERDLTNNNHFYPLPSELQIDEFLTELFTPAESNLALCQLLIRTFKKVTELYRRNTSEENEQEEEHIQEKLFDQLYRESLFKAYTLIGRITTLIEEEELKEVKTDTFRRLLNRLLSAASIPFHGEPAIGMQVMGVLETRNLDFKHLIILSLNEGKLPKTESDSSFIPYSLRKAYGMTTIEHKNAVYAYYFYRLIQRAEHITMLYNTSTEGLNRGEMSRFMLQYLVDSPHDIDQYYLETEQKPQQSFDICIEKDEELLLKLYNSYDVTKQPDTYLSPSALNTYLTCPLSFYYRYVAHLKINNEVNEEIDNALFGTIFHRAAEMVYNELTAHGKEITKESIQRIIKEPNKLQTFVDKAFKEKFFHVPHEKKVEYNGVQLINSKVILSYLKQLLKLDMNYAPFKMEGMERKVTETIKVETTIGSLELNIGGTIDRIDSKDGTLRVVDYKTGGEPATIENIEQLFIPDPNRSKYIFQTFLYSAILCKQQPLKVTPALLYIHHAASESYSPIIKMGAARQTKIPVYNFTFYEEEFRQQLQKLLEEIFNPHIPFKQTQEKMHCDFCDFRSICKR